MNAVIHPVFERLTASQASPFARHAVLHELEQRLEACPRKRSFSAKVHAVVDRGVPYFSPTDPHYREWAAQIAELWEELATTA